MIIRPATLQDADGLCGVLNPIIARGGTTAHLRHFDADRMRQHYIAPDGKISCMLADADDTVFGFQSLVWPTGPDHGFEPGWAIIASFVSSSARGKGVGAQLFAATLGRAKNAGVKTIDAAIRADNDLGLAFYDRLGFRDYTTMTVTLSDGRRSEKVCKRFDL